jgi:hypothetical protein
MNSRSTFAYSVFQKGNMSSRRCIDTWEGCEKRESQKGGWKVEKGGWREGVRREGGVKRVRRKWDESGWKERGWRE